MKIQDANRLILDELLPALWHSRHICRGGKASEMQALAQELSWRSLHGLQELASLVEHSRNGHQPYCRAKRDHHAVQVASKSIRGSCSYHRCVHPQRDGRSLDCGQQDCLQPHQEKRMLRVVSQATRPSLPRRSHRDCGVKRIDSSRIRELCCALVDLSGARTSSPCSD